MNYYATDQEQFEIIKKWFQEYGITLVVAIVLGLALGFGWWHWRQHQLTVSFNASQLFAQLLSADAKQDKQMSQQVTDQILRQYPKTPYATMANFLTAKEAVIGNDIDSAKAKLQWVIAHSQIPSFKQIARIRLARLCLEQGKPQEGLKILATVDDKSYKPVIENIQGDIYLAMGESDKAKQAYQSALNDFNSIGAEDPLLQMKAGQPFKISEDK